jgi:hypothetical protein
LSFAAISLGVFMEEFPGVGETLKVKEVQAFEEDNVI